MIILLRKFSFNTTCPKSYSHLQNKNYSIVKPCVTLSFWSHSSDKALKKFILSIASSILHESHFHLVYDYITCVFFLTFMTKLEARYTKRNQSGWRFFKNSKKRLLLRENFLVLFWHLVFGSVYPAKIFIPILQKSFHWRPICLSGESKTAYAFGDQWNKKYLADIQN